MRRRLVPLPRPCRLSSPPAFGSTRSPRPPRARSGSPWPCHPGTASPGASGCRMGAHRNRGSPSPPCHRSARGDPGSAVPPCPWQTNTPCPHHSSTGFSCNLLISHFPVPATITGDTNLTTNLAAHFPSDQIFHLSYSLGREMSAAMLCRHPRVGPHQ